MPQFKVFLKFLYDGCLDSCKEINDKFTFLDQNLPLTNLALTKVGKILFKIFFRVDFLKLISTSDLFKQLLLYLRNCMLYECHPSLCTVKFDHPCHYTSDIGTHLKSLYLADKSIVEWYLDLLCRITCQTESENFERS